MISKQQKTNNLIRSAFYCSNVNNNILTSFPSTIRNDLSVIFEYIMYSLFICLFIYCYFSQRAGGPYVQKPSFYIESSNSELRSFVFICHGVPCSWLVTYCSGYHLTVPCTFPLLVVSIFYFNYGNLKQQHVQKFNQKELE